MDFYAQAKAKDSLIEKTNYIHYHNNSYDIHKGESIAQRYFLRKSNALARYKTAFQSNISQESLNYLSQLENLSDPGVIERLNRDLAASVQSALNRTGYNFAAYGDNIAEFRTKYKTLFSNRQPEMKQIVSFILDAKQLYEQMGYDASILGSLLAHLHLYGAKGNSHAKFSAGASARGTNFLSLLENFKKQNEGKFINVSRNGQPAINFIEKMIQRMSSKERGVTAHRGSYSTRKMSALITSIFNEGVGEYAIGDIIGSMVLENDEQLINHLLTGTARTSSIGIDNKERQVQIKPDIYAPGFVLNYNKDHTTLQVRLDLGASVKTYSSGYAATQGVTLGSRYLIQDLLNAKVNQYHAVNTLIYSPENGRRYYYGFLVKQYINYLISGNNAITTQNGVLNFANILIVNGTVYSIYDLINQTLQANSLNYFENMFTVTPEGASFTQHSWVGKGGGADPIWAQVRSNNANDVLKQIKYKVQMRLQPQKI